MAKIGRPSKPADLKKLEGNPGNRPIKEPVRPDGALARPAYVTGYAAEIWERVVSAMPPTVYAATDADALAAYCMACDQLREAWSYLRTEGHVIRPVIKIVEDGETGDLRLIYGKPFRNPWGVVAREAMEKIATLGNQLGLNPIARENLGAKPADDGKPKGKFTGLVGIPGGKAS